jgi:hypothetical protein
MRSMIYRNCKNDIQEHDRIHIVEERLNLHIAKKRGG